MILKDMRTAIQVNVVALFLAATAHAWESTGHQVVARIAWTRSFREARVFCLQSGHDIETYVNPNFRTVVLRGIRWCPGRI